MSSLTMPDSPLIAFAHLPKTAGMSVHRIMRRTYGTRYCVVKGDWRGGPFGADDLKRLRNRYPRLRAVGGHSILPRPGLRGVEPGLRFWTMLREPLTRTASHYAYMLQRGQTDLSVAEWVTQPRLRNVQTERIAGVEDADEARRVLESQFFFVGLVEEFGTSLEMLRHQLPELAIPARPTRRNVGKLSSLRDELLADSSTRVLLEEANAEDLKLYETVAATIWPHQVAADSGTPAAAMEVRARVRESASLTKERLLLGVPRRLRRAGVRPWATRRPL